MAKRNSELARATVTRLAHVKEDIRIQQDAVTLAIDMAETYIRDLFKGALQFTEHRGGTMILKKDIDAYLKSIEKKS